MRAFNKDDYDQVLKYEEDFKRAIESRYAKGVTQTMFDELSKVYRETLNRQANYSCGGCVLQMLTSVGRLYFNFKKELEIQARKEEEAKKKEKSQKSGTRGRRTSNKNKEDKKDVHKDKIEEQGGKGSTGDVSDNQHLG